MNTLDERLKQIASQKQLLEEEEAALRDEAAVELESVRAQIETLEARRDQLEAFLGLSGANGRAAHGQIVQLCIDILSERGGGLTTADIRDGLEQQHPTMKLTSVPATLSRLVSAGRLRRDEAGRYYLA